MSAEREPFHKVVYWRLWFWWHRHFDWCVCECDYCGHRFVHDALCSGSSRCRRGTRQARSVRGVPPTHERNKP